MPGSELRNMAAEAREPSPTGFITVFFLVPLFPSSAPLTQGFDANRERERGVISSGHCVGRPVAAVADKIRWVASKKDGASAGEGSGQAL